MMPSVKKESTSKVEGLSKREEKKRINIRWNSGLYFQIGLIISMLFVFLIIESNLGISTMAYVIPETKELNEVSLKNYVLEVIPEKKIEGKEVIKKREPIKQVASYKFKPLDNIAIIKETDVAKNEVDVDSEIKPANTQVEGASKKITPNPNLLSVQQVPIFPGCESLTTNKERRECFNDKVNAFINRKFNVDRFAEKYAGELNRIDVQFTINSNGDVVNVITRNPHADLNNEAKRVIRNLPKMIPGSHENRKVDVLFNVPIMLDIIN